MRTSEKPRQRLSSEHPCFFAQFLKELALSYREIGLGISFTHGASVYPVCDVETITLL